MPKRARSKTRSKVSLKEGIKKYITDDKFKGFIDKKILVDNIIKLYQKQSNELDSDSNELTSSNYVYNITNDLMWFNNNKNTTKFIEIISGPSYKVPAEELKDNVVKKTIEHVKKILNNMEYKELFCLLGYKSEPLVDEYIK